MTVPLLSCCLVTSRLNSERSYPSVLQSQKMKSEEEAVCKGYKIGLWIRTQVFQFFGCLFFFFGSFFFSISPHCPLSLNSWLQNDLLVLLTGCVSWIQTPLSYSRKNFGTNSVPVCFPSLPWPGCHLLCRDLHLCPDTSWYITWQLQAPCLGWTLRTYLICSPGLFLSKHQSIG